LSGYKEIKSRVTCRNGEVMLAPNPRMARHENECTWFREELLYGFTNVTFFHPRVDVKDNCVVTRPPRPTKNKAF
jgi:hypothetical protein